MVSHEKSREIWNKAYRFAPKASPNDHLALDFAFQGILLEHLSGLTASEKAATRSFDDPKLKEVFKIAETNPLVLVDIPPDRTEGMHELNFFGESDRWRYYEDDLVNIRVENSVVWSSIIKDFGISLGKIRIFVHTEVAHTVRAVDPANLESMFETALIEWRIRQRKKVS